MRPTFALTLLVFSFIGLYFGPSAPIAFAQEGSTDRKPTVFHIKYIADHSVYVDAGRNADIREGMKLSVIAPPPDNAATDGLRFRGYPRIAELSVVSVAESSSVCDIISSAEDLKVGEFAFLAPTSVEDGRLAETASEADRYPIVVEFRMETR